MSYYDWLDIRQKEEEQHGGVEDECPLCLRLRVLVGGRVCADCFEELKNDPDLD